MDNAYTRRGNANRSYMRLEVWQRAMELFELVWRITHAGRQLDFKLRSQLCDAAQSVSSNISEGYSRRSINEYIQFLYIALGSLSETLTRSAGLRITGQIASEEFEQVDALHYEVENKLAALIRSLEQKRGDGDWADRLREESGEYAIHPPIQ